MSEWDGKWRWFCNLSIADLADIDAADLLLVAQDALDNGVFRFDEGSAKEVLSDKGIEYSGDMAAGFVPRLQAMIDKALREYKPFSALAGWTDAEES